MKRKGRDRNLGRPSILDLQMMFLKSIGDEAPDAVADLFLIGNAEEWARKHHASAKWLVDFASHALRLNRQGWVANQPSRSRGDLALATWKSAIANRRRIVAALDDAALTVGADYDDETLDKREAETHCRWVALSLFVKGITNEQIRKRWPRYQDIHTISKRKHAMAKILGIDLPKSSGGRPRKK